jgi:hypothetical protein
MSDSIGKNEHTEPSGLPLNQERFMQLYDEWDGLGVLERFITDKLIASESALRTLREERDRLEEVFEERGHQLEGLAEERDRALEALRRSLALGGIGFQIGIAEMSGHEKIQERLGKQQDEIEAAIRAVLAKHPAPKQEEG